MPPEAVLVDAIAQALGETRSPVVHPARGGDINQALVARFGHDLAVFVKYGGVSEAGFAAEAEALRELRECAVDLVVPQPLAWGEASGHAFLVLEHLDLRPPGSASEAALGRGLARLHQVRQPFFGWHRDNTIGATPQPNPRTDQWPEFFVDHRLRHQARLLADDAIERAVAQLGGRIARFFEGHEAVPSLLHGDLWSGNRAALDDGRPAIFDPASYYGCRETDLAMTELFGRFGAEFYEAYHRQWPLSPGYERRRPLYQLYHVLNHANLFGGGYRRQAATLLARLVDF